MKFSRMIGPLLGLLPVFASAQGWSSVYERGLNAVRAQRWEQARAAFQEASTIRPDDFAGVTTLPGSITDPKRWRDGLPYSPNYAAAYASYRIALESRDDDAKSNNLRTAASEFKLLLDKGQLSKESVFFLGTVLAELRDMAALQALDARLQTIGSKLNWKVDPEITSPEEQAMINALTLNSGVSVITNASNPLVRASQPQQPGPKPDARQPIDVPPVVKQPTEAPAKAVDKPKTTQSNPTTDPKQETKPPATNNQQKPPKPKNPTADPVGQGYQQKPAVKPTNPTGFEPTVKVASDPGLVGAGGNLAKVATLESKFALLIGNGESKIAGASPSFAATDALLLRESLVQHAGYAEANIDVLQNATADQMLAAAEALAQRVQEGNSVFIFFSGYGTNLEGLDFLAGVDTQLSTDRTTMIGKSDVFRLFMARGARIFAFFQVNRPIANGRYFGMEVPLVGAISQMQSTIPGRDVNSMISGGKQVGLFTLALNNVLAEYRSNQVPILEFSWSVFDKMRHGGVGTGGGGSSQVPTLPVITNMASDSRF